MQIDIITLFPGMLTGFLTESMIGRARERGLVEIATHNLRDWGEGKWSITDDRPFGGGAGMLLKPEPLCAAIDSVKKEDSVAIYLSPDGEPFNHAMAVELSRCQHLVLVSGHYEGIDQRVRDTRIDREVSIGDFVLTNGTLPAAVIIDAVVRQIPGVLGAEKSLTQDSFHRNVLGFPQYTRPVEFEGMRVPEVLLSGNHGEIERWREEQALEKTRERRPDLLSKKDS
ncbi:MAG: tRNA (guanosine(37)-N1)-methyltransferase TrmD [Opitutales bacterium]|jgi:tRNA (guanine37-N1)-methyltransferase